MQTPFEVLNIGADVAKGEIVAACSEGVSRCAGLSMMSGVAKAGKLQILLASLGHCLPFLRTFLRFTLHCLSVG